MAAPCQPCNTGLSRCHLRRIGSRASVPGVDDVIHFSKTVTLFGRNRDVVDCFLSGATPRRSGYISRIHARVIRTSEYELVDSSLTGVYVNDVRIPGRVVLQEGDTVTFGHPASQSMASGAWARQPNSPFYFLFEHCHCSLDQMCRRPGELPVLAAAGASPKVTLGLEMKTALPPRTYATPGALPPWPALSELNVSLGCCRPAAFSTLALPLPSAASAQPPVTLLPSTGSVYFSSSLLEVPDGPQLGVSLDSSLESSVQSASRIVRSTSPEYVVPEEEMPGPAEPSPQGALETKKCSSLIHKKPKLNCSDPASGNQEHPVGYTSGFHRLSPHKNCNSEDGTHSLQAVCLDHVRSVLPASACLEDSVAAEIGNSRCGARVGPAELPKDAQQLACSFQTMVGGSPELEPSPPSTHKLASSVPDHSQEITEMEIDESTEEMAESETSCVSEPGDQERNTEPMEEIVSRGQVTSASCSKDSGLGNEGTVEGHGEIVTEEPLPDVLLPETELEEDGSVTSNSLVNRVDSLAPETLDLLSDRSGSRTPDNLLCGQEPDGVSPARLGIEKEMGPQALGTAGPCEVQSVRGACEADSRGRASEDEGDVEMLLQRDTKLLATDRHLESVDPEMERDVTDGEQLLGEQSFAEVGTQTGGPEERETSPVMAEGRGERGTSGGLGILRHSSGGLNAHVAKEALLQQLSKASTSDFLTREVSSKGSEFPREGASIAAASSVVMQENLSSEDLLETCKEDTTLEAAAAPPADSVWGNGMDLEEPLQADLLEQPMDLDGKRSEECPSQRSETCPKGVPEAVAAERELEYGSPGGTEPDPAAEGQLAAGRLGPEEERRKGETPAVGLAGGWLAVPDSLCGWDGEGPEEAGRDGASGGEEPEAHGGRSTAVASPAGAAVGEGGPENQLKGLQDQPSVALPVCRDGAGRALGRSLEGGTAYSSPAVACGRASLHPPFRLSDDTLEEGGIPPSEDFCAGTQLPFQRSEEDTGGRLEPESSRLSPERDGSEGEQEADLDKEVQSCSVGTKPVENAQQHHKMAEPEEKGSQAERRTDCHESDGASSCQSTLSGCQEEGTPLPQSCQEPEWHACQPQGPENSTELKPQGANGGKGLLSLEDLPMEGNAWEEICEPDVAAECLTPPGLEGCREEGVVPEHGHELERSPGGSCSGEEKGMVSEQSRALQGSPTRHLARQNQIDSAVVPESSSSDELNLHISDSEAKREETDSSQAHGASGREAVLLEEKAAFSSGSVERLDGVPANGEAPGRPTEPWAPWSQSEAASQETGGGPPKATGMLGPQNFSCYEPCCDLSRAAVSVPETSVTHEAADGKSPPLMKAAAAGEEDRDPGGAELVPLDLSCVSEEVSCLLERDAELGIEEQGPGGASGAAEDVGSDLLEDCELMDSRVAGQPGMETLEVGKTPEEHLQSEISASTPAGEVDCPQEAGGEAQLHLQQEAAMLQPQENGSQSKEGPKCSKRLKSSEYSRGPFPEEEELEDCPSRKRLSGEDQVLGMADSEHDSYGQKRLRLLDSGSDLHSSTGTPSAPSDLEGHWDQFGRTVGKFLQQYGSQISLRSDEMEEKHRDSIAQIVRMYFNGTLGLEEPVAENLDAEMSALPLEAGTPEEADCNSPAKSEAERSAAGEEKVSSLTPDSDLQVNPVLRQDPSLDSHCSPASTPSRSLGSHTEQPGQELAHHVPESAWEAYFSEEEEEFQSSISSVLDHSLLNSPAASPNVQCGQEPYGKNVDLVFSDISNSSVESEHCDPSPKPERRSSAGMGSGQLDGMLSEAVVVDLSLGDARCSPEATDVGWCKEETSALSSMHVSSCERVRIPEGDLLEEPGDHLDAVGENTGAPVLRQLGGTFGGEDGLEMAHTEASGRVAFSESSPVGETREELDSHVNKTQIGGDAFLQRSHEDPPSQELERKPTVHQLSDLTLWDRCSPSTKVALSPCHVRELSHEDGKASSSREGAVASESAGFPTAVDPQDEDSVLQSPSLSHMTPFPGQTQAGIRVRSSLLQNGLRLLKSVKQDGCAKTEDADARGDLQSEDGGASLCPLLPRGPAGVADDPGQRGLERDLGRSGARGTRQTDISRAANTGSGGGPLLTVGVCGNQVPAYSPSGQGEAPALTRSPGLPSVSRIIKEEPDPCDSQVQVEGFSPCGAYPMACSPVIPVLQKARIAEASENWVPGSPVGPMDFRNKEEWLLPCQLDEAEAPGKPGAACVPSGDEHSPCTEAKKRHSSTLVVSPDASDTPPQGDPWSYEGSSAQNASTSSAGGVESSPGKRWASSEQDVAFQLQECQAVLEEISQALCTIDGIDDLHMERWREQIAELQKATKMPRTYIAVVGNTGAGKSSLLNALLDEEAVLPTSAMRACTAVVVEVSRAAGGSPYEADVEFLSQEEWYKELTVLLEDMKDKSGNLKKRCPDRKTEAGAAYSRVKAVYGRVGEVAELKHMQDVTQYLGTVKHISAATAADFRTNIEKFIDSRTDNLRDMKGGEFWPIVKCVKVRVAQAEVLKTGVVLVDLPGIRDSNAARDNAAKEYLKNCNAVWVVASITRAVDDKAAKEILNSNLRRQLFMDGQYGNLAFICTKTDSFNISDIVRDLDLREEIQPLEEELEELEQQRMQAAEEKGTLRLALQPEQRQGDVAADPAWLQRHYDFLAKELQLSALQKQKEAKLRAISLICVQARNRFSKQRIWMDFSAGLEELKRKAELSECDDDGEEDLEEGDFAGSDPGDLGQAESQQEKLHVFTVSSTEYLKLSGKLLRDGQAQVFHDPKDTEIPALKNFAIGTGLKTGMKATEKVIRDVARVISQIVHYLTNQRAEDISHQAQAQEILQQALEDIPRLLQEAVDDTFPDVQYCFRVQINVSLAKGSNKAKELCEDIVRSWGSHDFGFAHATYHAVCLRHGFYSSPKHGTVDFNQRLAKPISDAISTTWHEVFNSKLEESFKRFTMAVLERLKFFFRELKRNLGGQSGLLEALQALHRQQMEAVQARLFNFLLDQEACISKRQRTISRILIPTVQNGMEPAYAECSRMSGPGYFQRMKDVMESFVHNHKDSIFDAATEKMKHQLNLLQQRIQKSFQNLVQELNKSLRMQFEPLLKPVQKNAEAIPDLMNICAKVDKICKRSCVEYVLPSATQAEMGSPETERELRGSPACFSASCMDIGLEAVSLSQVVALQQSTSDAEMLPEVPAAVSGPPPVPQVISVVQQQPQLPQVNLLPYGRKRAGEASQALLEKRHKSQAGPDQAGGALPSCSWSMESKTVPCGPRAASCPLPTSGECVPGDCRQKAGWLLGAAQHRTPAGELTARPGSAGYPGCVTVPRLHSPDNLQEPMNSDRESLRLLSKLHSHGMRQQVVAGAPIRAKEGIWGKCHDPSSKGDNDMILKTEPVEHSRELLAEPLAAPGSAQRILDQKAQPISQALHGRPGCTSWGPL